MAKSPVIPGLPIPAGAVPQGAPAAGAGCATPSDGRSYDVGAHGMPVAIADDKVLPEWKRALMESKITLVRRFPFIGFLIMTTKWNFTDTKHVETACATEQNGPEVFINPQNFLSLSAPQRAAELMHEDLHIYLMHIGRARDHAYHGPLWNVATDFVINAYIQNLECADVQIGKDWLHDKRFDGMGADEVYYILLKESKGDAGAAAAKYGSGTGKPGVNGQRPLDGVSSEGVSSAQEMEKKQSIAASIANHNSINKNMGTGEADLLRMFEKMLETKIPWQKELAEFVTATARNRFTYNRVSRRSEGAVVFPTLTGDHIKLAFGVDTSGSMSPKDLDECIAQLNGIINDFDSWEMVLMSCDTKAHIMGEYNSEEGDDITTINKKMIGGGGTDMNPMVEYVNEMEEKPAVLVICTDGVIPPVNTMEDVPVILVITNDGNKQLVNEGTHIIFMNDRE